MVFPNKKRDFSYYLEEEEEEEGEEPLKRKASISSFSYLLGAELSSPRSLSYIEAYLLRPVVRDEVERQVEAHFDLPRSSSSSKQVRDRSEEDEVIGTAKLKLCFVNKIPPTIFTKNQIEGENGQLLQVALWDITTNSYYNLEGTNPLLSAMIEFVVLDGEFGSDLQDQEPRIRWSVAEFNKSIVTQSAGERPLLVGSDKTTRLKNGVAFVNDLTFTGNSSRNRTKRIRLGVRIKDPEISNKYPRTGEAVSNAFRVKDHRGESIQKNHPPKGEDEVYRLEGIGKERSSRLATEGIRTVDDFVKSHQSNPHSLRQLLGKRVSEKQWNEMVKHASEYVPLIPTFNDIPNSQLNNQTIMNPTSYNNGFGDPLLDQSEGHYPMFQGLWSPLLSHVGEASTLNADHHHDEVENSNPFDQINNLGQQYEV